MKALNGDYKRLEVLFHCLDCGKTMTTPNHEYACGDCGESHDENQLNVKRNFAFIVEDKHRVLISKWVKDFDNILESAREFYRGMGQPYDSNAPITSYAAMAKKGEGVRYDEQSSA